METGRRSGVVRQKGDGQDRGMLEERAFPFALPVNNVQKARDTRPRAARREHKINEGGTRNYGFFHRQFTDIDYVELVEINGATS